MEGDEYLGFSGRCHDPHYCHWIADLSEDSQAVVFDFLSNSCKLNSDQACDNIYELVFGTRFEKNYLELDPKRTTILISNAVLILIGFLNLF